MTKQPAETPRLEAKPVLDPDEIEELLNVIGGSDTAKKLIAALGDAHFSIRAVAAKTLLGMRPAPTQPLIEALSDHNSNIRGKAAELLGYLGDPCAVQPLICRLQDPEWYVRGKAVEALGSLKDSRAVDALVTIICADDKVFMLAAKALQNMNDKRSIELLAGHLHDDDPGVRRRATGALHLLDNSYTIELLLDALHNKESQVRKLAVIYGKNHPELRALSDSHLQDAITMLIIRDLGQLRNIRAIRPLFELHDHQDPHIRTLIDNALALIREANEERLLADLNGQDLFVQVEAREMLELLAARKASEKDRQPTESKYIESEASPATVVIDLDEKPQDSRQAYKKPTFKRPLFLTMVTIFLIIILIAVGTIRYFSALTPPSTSSSYPFSQSLVLSDPLKTYNGDHGWDIRKVDQSLCVFKNGAYHAYSDASSPAICIARSTIFSNFTYEVQMKLVSGDFGGIIFRYIELQRAYYYAFGISQAGRYIILPIDPQSSSKEVDGQSSAIITGYNQSNLLAVVASGKSLRFYVNGHEITEITGGTINQGSIGVFALYIVNPTDAQFSNAKVWKLPN